MSDVSKNTSDSSKNLSISADVSNGLLIARVEGWGGEITKVRNIRTHKLLENIQTKHTREMA